MILIIVVVAAICVAFANGANDNFKGVATLFGSGTTNYKRALLWATGMTFLGSLAAVMLAGNLIKTFGGKGLIEDAIAKQSEFAAAVALGAGLTVLLATRIGMPISTTHSLMGALIGTGLAAGSSINLSTLGTKFLIPLLTSPVIAVLVTIAIYPLLSFLRKKSGITSEYCICVGEKEAEVIAINSPACQSIAADRVSELTVSTGETVSCESRYSGKMVGLDAGSTLDSAHYLSSGIVSFARGLNDTPKIAALLLLVPAFTAITDLATVGVAIAIGALICARRVAETMSKKITAMNHGQGFTCNVITGLIVIGFSRFGLPVSTTHVSCGSLFGLGAITGRANKQMIGTILLAWVSTLPIAGCMAAISYMIFGYLK